MIEEEWRLSNGWDLETAMSKRQWERNRWTVEAG